MNLDEKIQAYRMQEVGIYEDSLIQRNLKGLLGGGVHYYFV